MEKDDIVVNFAAESHVDRSIEGPSEFIKTNVLGTQVLLSAAVNKRAKIFLQVSTDEVYGSIAEGKSIESDHLFPNSPYSASKASADLLVRSYIKTFGLDARITRCCNNFGPNQYPEKFIPLAIENLKNGKNITIYGDGSNVREWIHVDDHCRGIQLVIKSGSSGDIYNIGSSFEISNIDLSNLILGVTGMTSDHIEFIADRKGHDLRYSLDSSLIRNKLGFRIDVDPIENLNKFISSTFKKAR
jgi:dTDP-glucose 4,6-dehydratase